MYWFSSRWALATKGLAGLAEYGVHSSGFRGVGFRVWGLGFRAQSFGVRVQCLGART